MTVPALSATGARMALLLALLALLPGFAALAAAGLATSASTTLGLSEAAGAFTAGAVQSLERRGFEPLPLALARNAILVPAGTLAVACVSAYANPNAHRALSPASSPVLQL